MTATTLPAKVVSTNNFRTPDVLPKSFHYDGVFGVRCEPKTVRFLRRQGKAHDSYSTKSEQKLTGVFYC